MHLWACEVASANGKKERKERAKLSFGQACNSVVRHAIHTSVIV